MGSRRGGRLSHEGRAARRGDPYQGSIRQIGELVALLVENGSGPHRLQAQQERAPMPPDERFSGATSGRLALIARAPERGLIGNDGREVADADPHAVRGCCMEAIT